MPQSISQHYEDLAVGSSKEPLERIWCRLHKLGCKLPESSQLRKLLEEVAPAPEMIPLMNDADRFWMTMVLSGVGNLLALAIAKERM